MKNYTDIESVSVSNPEASYPSMTVHLLQWLLSKYDKDDEVEDGGSFGKHGKDYIASDMEQRHQTRTESGLFESSDHGSNDQSVKISQEDFQGWLETLMESTEPLDTDDTLDIAGEPVYMASMVELGSRLLRECLLTHRWKTALHVLQDLLVGRRRTYERDLVLNKVGLDICELTSYNQKSDMSKWEKSTRKLFTENRELNLEHGLHMAAIGDIEAALLALKEHHTHHRTNVYGDIRHQEIWKELSRAYTGLLHYAKWEILKQRLGQIEDREEFKTKQEVMSIEDEMDRLIDKVQMAFRSLAEKPGVWDIFISKYAKMAAYYGQKDEVLTALRSYAANHAGNPTSHAMLYQNLTKYDCDIKERISTLRKLADLAPSDELVVDLCEMLLVTEERNEGLHRLFNLLDYAVCQCEPRPWCLLACQLEQKKPGDEDIVADCWREREDWWPAYHFCVRSIPRDSAQPQLLMDKAKVAVLLHQGVDYVERCMKAGCDSEVLQGLMTQWPKNKEKTENRKCKQRHKTIEEEREMHNHHRRKRKKNKMIEERTKEEMIKEETTYQDDPDVCAVCGSCKNVIRKRVPKISVCVACTLFLVKRVANGCKNIEPCPFNQQCNITRDNRNRCLDCRLQKCIALGLTNPYACKQKNVIKTKRVKLRQTDHAEKDDSSPKKQTHQKPNPAIKKLVQKLKCIAYKERKKSDLVCAICGVDNATYYHGAFSCSPCKRFFLKISKSKTKCKPCNKECSITKYDRNCGYCRFEKCIAAGMIFKARFQ